ncbi:MAG: ribosome silencing factor [Candidatus Latescibacteria bacterium]|nr:ribosome silencing factor [Candidatus Latescibacterota bacterium]
MPDTIEMLRSASIEHLQSRKAEDLIVIDLREIADFVDYFIIGTGTSDVHVRALADSVIEGLKAEGQRPWQVEGYDTRKWILIDFVDIVVHIFQPEARDFYGLERLWGDAPIEHIEDDETLQISN